MSKPLTYLDSWWAMRGEELAMSVGFRRGTPIFQGKTMTYLVLKPMVTTIPIKKEPPRYIDQLPICNCGYCSITHTTSL